MEVLDRMRMDELDVLERLYGEIWSEDGARDGSSADEGNGSAVGVKRNGARKRRRASWRQIKEPISPRGLVRFENNIFRVVQRYGQLYITPKYRYIRISEKGRKTVQEAYEVPMMCYEEFFERFLKVPFNATTVNGRVSGIQQKFLRSIMEEGVLPMTGDIVRRC